MQIQLLKSKIHHAVITEANLHYMGSLTLDVALMEAANLIDNEKIHVVNINNGERLETYLISYAILDFEEAKNFSPRIVFPKEGNLL